MSSAGRAVSTNGCVSKPKGRETGLPNCVRQIRSSSLTGSYVMETAEQREPYESRGSRTVLGAPGGETPPGDSTFASFSSPPRHVRLSSETHCESRRAGPAALGLFRLNAVRVMKGRPYPWARPARVRVYPGIPVNARPSRSSPIVIVTLVIRLAINRR